jgi:hypothetical protein
MFVSALCCAQKTDLQKERAAIIRLLNMERKANFEKKYILFMSEFSDSMISVNRGVVSPINMDETRKRIQGYFNKVEFLKWDDIVAPKISFSKNGSMTYAILQKQVILKIKDTRRETPSIQQTLPGLRSILKAGMNGSSNATYRQTNN